MVWQEKEGSIQGFKARILESKCLDLHPDSTIYCFTQHMLVNLSEPLFSHLRNWSVIGRSWRFLSNFWIFISFLRVIHNENLAWCLAYSMWFKNANCKYYHLDYLYKYLYKYLNKCRLVLQVYVWLYPECNRSVVEEPREIRESFILKVYLIWAAKITWESPRIIRSGEVFVIKKKKKKWRKEGRSSW